MEISYVVNKYIFILHKESPMSNSIYEWRHRSRRYYRRPKTKQERTANSSLYNSKSNEWCRGKRTPHALDPWSSIERPIDLNYKSWKNRRKKKTIS